MIGYKKWTAEQRVQSLKLTNQAKALGLLEDPRQCSICGQDKGILHTHNTDYDVTLSLTPKLIDGTFTQEELLKVKSVLVPLCWRCHMMLHKKERHPESYKRYIESINNGVKYRPVFHGNAWYEIDKLIID